MSMQEAFDRGDFLSVAESAFLAETPEEKLLVAVSLLKLGKATDAMAIFRDISNLVTGLSKAFLHMAQVHRDRGETESAKLCLEKYLLFHPEDDEAADILLEGGQESAPLVSEPSHELAKIYASQGHFEQALDIYVSLIKDGAQDPQMEREARRVQTMHVIKTLEGWLEKLKK